MYLRITIILITSIVVILLIFLLFSEITSYRPKKIETLFKAENSTILPDTADFSIITWNIGYAGLGNDMSFFYDGGEKMRTSMERTMLNHDKILKFISENSYIDFFLLQEVDVKSKRSYYLNTLDSLKKISPNAMHSFGYNYKVKHVPLPALNPMGKVNSGILTISHAIPSIVERHSYAGNYPWPNRLFNLKRCFVINRYPISNGKELIIINTHNSAFDDGSLRDTQMQQLKEIMINEYLLGNFVVAGGDWNQCPPEFRYNFTFNLFDSIDNKTISPDFLPDWNWAYDNTTPTNRRITTPYDAGSILTTVIDFFVFSPNIKVTSVEGMHLDFEYSDHNPVKATFRLGGEQ
ncbi:MAG: endonuclease/exonuclease/phosphatase family protein [Bacteroidetes bacterium]|nr:endonuclease/exonuclease/phosphatase family protein [Bacteroidota bacterium]